MIALLLCITAGANVFVEQELEGIVIGRPNPLNGRPSVNFRSEDLDQDGMQDILLPDRLLLQRSGEFPPGLSVALPRSEGYDEYDVFDGMLYRRSGGELEIYRLEGMTWKRVLGQSIAWPDLEAANEEAPSAHDATQKHGVLGRFLYDIFGNGVPEIVVPGADGLYVYVNRGLGYTTTHVLDVYASPKVVFPARATLWPPEARAVSYPSSRLKFRLVLDADSISVFSRSLRPDNLVRHRISRWRVDAEKGYRPQPDNPPAARVDPLPSFLQPCRLNDDDTPDFAGIRRHVTETSPIPEPIQEIVATTDGGRTLQSFRSKSFRTLCAFIDFDGDGDLDAIVETTHLYRGGLKEFLTRSMSERTLRHTIRVHLQDGRGRFSTAPDLSHTFSIKLLKPPFRNGPLFSEYQNGGLINVTGDVDGDGKRDLVVRTHPDRLSIFLNKNLSFDKTPDRTLPIPREARFGLADVDGDGRSDIVVYGSEALASNGAERALIHFSRTTSP